MFKHSFNRSVSMKNISLTIDYMLLIMDYNHVENYLNYPTFNIKTIGIDV